MYMSEERVKEILDFVKAPPHSDNYGRWGALNPEQRRTISELCNSWLMLNDIVERYRILTGGTFEEPKEDRNIEDTSTISKLYINNKLQYDLTPKEDKKIEKVNRGCIAGDNLRNIDWHILDKLDEIIDKINGGE